MNKDFNKNWWVYIIECRNNVLYTGITMNVEEKFIEDRDFDNKIRISNNKLGPLKLVYKSQPFNNKSLASREEWRINRLTKDQKILLIKSV